MSRGRSIFLAHLLAWLSAMSCGGVQPETEHTILGVFSIVIGKVAITQGSQTCKFLAVNTRPRRALLCLDIDAVFQIATKALRIQRRIQRLQRERAG